MALSGSLEYEHSLNGTLQEPTSLSGELSLPVGGEGGTTDYNALYNIPTINGTELKGNLTTDDLGIVVSGDGTPEIYIGSGDMPDGYKLQIDTSGEATSVVEDVLVGGVSVVNENNIANIPKATNGVYIGDGEMPDDCVLRINPNGEATNIVSDVQINGTSIITNGVANVSIANYNDLGLVKGYLSGGVLVNGQGQLYIATATESDLTNRNKNTRAITSSNYDLAVKTAMCDGKGTAWTTDEKLGARNRLGLEWRYIGKVETAEDVSTLIIEVDENGNPFSLRKVRILFKSMPNQSDLANQIKLTINNSKWQQDWFSSGVKLGSNYRVADIELEKICNHLRVNTLYGSKNATTTCDTFTTLYDANAYFYSRSELNEFINSIKLIGVGGNTIGANSIVEIWGVDA